VEFIMGNRVSLFICKGSKRIILPGGCCWEEAGGDCGLGESEALLVIKGGFVVGRKRIKSGGLSGG